MRLIALFALVPFALASIPKCAKTNIVEHRQMETNGVKFNFTISECAETAGHFKPLTDAEVKAIEKRDTFRDYSVDIQKRQGSNQCTLPVPNCICGVGCTDTVCEAPRGPITQTDCASLALALIQTAGTFLIQPGQFAGVSSKTCTYAVFNNEATNLQEYCYNVMGNVGFSQLNLHCPGAEGFCGGGTLLGVSRFFVEQISTSIV